MDPEKKALKIKCDVCTRLLKDIEGYRAEQVEQRQRVDELLANNAGNWILSEPKAFKSDFLIGFDAAICAGCVV